MSIFGKIRDKIVDRLFGIKRNAVAEQIVHEAVTQSKYWKNFKDFDKYDFVKVPCGSSSEKHGFIEMPSKRGANILDLVLNPAIQNVTFSMGAFYRMCQPIVCFVGTRERYTIPAEPDTYVYEIGRIFIRLAPNGPDDLSTIRNIGEARYVVAENDKTVQVLPVIIASEDALSKTQVETFFALASQYYIAIQYALKYKPEIIRGIVRGKGNKKSADSTKSQPGFRREVKVRRIVSGDTPDEGTSVKEMKCLAWGVSGHYRHLKNGRVIWVKPYVKGKKRNDPEAYSPKIYRFLDENNL